MDLSSETVETRRFQMQLSHDADNSWYELRGRGRRISAEISRCIFSVELGVEQSAIIRVGRSYPIKVRSQVAVALSYPYLVKLGVEQSVDILVSRAV